MTAPDARVTSTHAIALAHRCGDHLLDTAIHHRGGASWLTPTVAPHDPDAVVDRTGDPGWYDGSAGIGHSCVEAGIALGRDELVGVGVAGIRHALGRVDEVDAVGLHDGRSGIAFAAIDAGGRLDDRAMVGAGATVLRSASAVPLDRVDVVDGLAGRAIALVAAAHLTGDGDLLDAARRDALALVERAERRPWGWSWPIDDGRALCGLAHGAAGVVQALVAVDAATGGAPELSEAIERGWQFERSWFDQATSSWPDLRTEPPDAPRPALWCHGSVGIGLARLAWFEWSRRPAFAAEALAAAEHASRDALATPAAAAPTTGFTRCHGTGGTVELLVRVGEVLGGTHVDVAHELIGRFAALAGDDPATWPGGLRGYAGPGRMNGVAGSMAVLLRAGGLTRPVPVGC